MKTQSLRWAAPAFEVISTFSKRNAIAAATRTVAFPPPAPDLLGKFGASDGRSGSDRGDRIRDTHRIGLAPHGENGGQPLRETHRALAGGVVPYCEPADSGCSESIAASHIARAAGPDEIDPFAVFLMAVEVPDLNGAPAGSQGRKRSGPRRLPAWV
jgi:hypothetical protein